MSKQKKTKRYPWPKKTTWGVHWTIENGKWVKKDGPPGIRKGQNFDARDSFIMYIWMSMGFLFFAISSLFFVEDQVPSLTIFAIFLISAIFLGIVAIYAFLSWREDVRNAEEVRKVREEKQRLWRENRNKQKKTRKK